MFLTRLQFSWEWVVGLPVCADKQRIHHRRICSVRNGPVLRNVVMTSARIVCPRIGPSACTDCGRPSYPVHSEETYVTCYRCHECNWIPTFAPSWRSHIQQTLRENVTTVQPLKIAAGQNRHANLVSDKTNLPCPSAPYGRSRCARARIASQVIFTSVRPRSTHDP